LTLSSLATKRAAEAELAQEQKLELNSFVVDGKRTLKKARFFFCSPEMKRKKENPCPSKFEAF